MDRPRYACWGDVCLADETPSPQTFVFRMPDRKSPRHSNFDYRSTAAYFVTICTHDRQCLFGRVRQGRVELNEYGQVAVEECCRSEELRDEVILDAYVVMPNHLHGIICIVPPDADDISPRGYNLDVGSDPTCLNNASIEDVGPHRHAALREGTEHPRRENGRPLRRADSLGSVIAGFKGAVTTRINRLRGTPEASVWQSRYHDRILRNEREPWCRPLSAWRARRRYIDRNPGRWAEDRHYPTQ